MNAGQAPVSGSGLATAATAALSVGMLAAATLGTVAAVVVGTASHLIGAPDSWAEAIAALAAAACLPFCATLALRAWRIERGGDH